MNQGMNWANKEASSSDDWEIQNEPYGIDAILQKAAGNLPLFTEYLPNIILNMLGKKKNLDSIEIKV